MKIAIPVFHTKISPRFDQTQEFVLLEMHNDHVVAKEKLATNGWPVSAKMRQILDMNVDTMICGGIDRASLQYLSANGMNIYSWITGEVDDVVACFLENKLVPGIIVGEHGCRTERWRFCEGRNHLCHQVQKVIHENKKGVTTMPRGDGTGPQGAGPRSGSSGGGCNVRKGSCCGNQRQAPGVGQGRSVKGGRKGKKQQTP